MVSICNALNMCAYKIINALVYMPTSLGLVRAFEASNHSFLASPLKYVLTPLWCQLNIFYCRQFESSHSLSILFTKSESISMKKERNNYITSVVVPINHTNHNSSHFLFSH